MSLRDNLIVAIENYVTASRQSHISAEGLVKYRQHILDVLTDMYAKVANAFLEGYGSKVTYNDVQITDPFEEWKKYNNEN